MRTQPRLLAAIVVLCAVWGWGACSTPLTADIIFYGNFAGSQVQFLNVQESSSAIGNGPGQVSELYGQPTVSNNSLLFSPSLFEALSQGAENRLIDGQLSFNLQAAPGYKITGISIVEFGDYTLSTPFPGGGAFVANSLTGFAANSDGVYTSNANFSDLQLNSDGPGVFGAVWNNSIDIAFAPTGAVTFDLDNTLNAASLANSSAFIKKKGVLIDIHTVAIPEAGSALAGLVLCGLVALRSRRRTA